MSGSKDRYAAFCERAYVPIYSKPWWMDAVCGPENWGVWLFEQGGEVAAAMPYYLEERELGRYITKPPLTQNNGIVFKHPEGAGPIARAKFEEKVVDEACEFIASLDLAVFEQQFHPSFQNWLPFSWNGYSALPRYTYVIEDTSDLDLVWAGFSAKQRSCIKKGMRNISSIEKIDPLEFYREHAKVFAKQDLSCPFTEEFWTRLWKACDRNATGTCLCARNLEGSAASLVYLVSDERSAYHLLGGNIPEHQQLDTYSALIWHAIGLACKQGIAYDFEGSMIKRISKSFREFGGAPKMYFRIRKVFNPDVVRAEAEKHIARLERDAV